MIGSLTLYYFMEKDDFSLVSSCSRRWRWQSQSESLTLSVVLQGAGRAA